MTRVTARRGGFTLLEVLLAGVIALMLMAALYAALDITLARTQANRELIDSSDLSRAVVNRMTADLTAGVGPLPPKSGGTPADSSGGSGGSTSSTTSTTSTTTTSGSGSGTGTGTGSTDSTSTSSTSSTSTDGTSGGTGTTDTTTTAVDIPFSAGVIGTAQQLTVFATRVPVAMTDPDAIATPDVLRPADVRRVTYYLGSLGGLCRQERPWATADGVRNTADPDLSTEDADLIAPEVVDLQFEYFDGGSGTWVTEWDGSQTDTDGVSLIGPPRAVRITLTLNVPTQNGSTVPKRVQHVVPIRSAVGFYVPPTDDTTTTTTGGM